MNLHKQIWYIFIYPPAGFAFLPQFGIISFSKVDVKNPSAPFILS